MSPSLKKVLGPRLSLEQIAEARARFLVPTLLLGLAGFLLLVSIFLPYWRLVLEAPQYPEGLEVRAYLNRLEGDVREIDGLNHYIGMRPLGEAAQLERTLSIAAVGGIALLALGAVYIHSKWALLFCLPALGFPFIFLADLAYWLRDFGTNLDPKAPLSSSIEPFVPPVLGRGTIGQFATVAQPDVGLILAFVASALIAVGLYFHRRAYKPLVEERKARANEGEPT